MTKTTTAAKRGTGTRKASLTVLALLFAMLPASPADTVRHAPPFTFASAGGMKTSASLRGNAVLLLVARTAKSKVLIKQLKNLKPVFHDLSSRGTIFVTAIVEGDAAVPSDIPFALASNAPAVAAAYGLRGEFLIAVIGRDGNVDVQTEKPLPGLRILEVIKNNFDVQEKSRRELPKGPPAQ